MNNTFLKFFFATIFILLLSFISSPATAQHFKKSKQYVHFISKRQRKTVKLFLRFTVAISGNANDKKATRLYNKLMDKLPHWRDQLDTMPAFKGNRTYKDAAVAFMDIYSTTLNDKYKNIDSIKKSAEKSYDTLKEFISDKESAYEKLEKVNTQLHAETVKFDSTFATKNNKWAKTMQQVGHANIYYDSVYLIFFKNEIQQMAVLHSIKKKNKKSLSQNGDSLAVYAQDGLDKLDTIKPFKHDRSLTRTCKYALKQYKKEAAKKISIVADYFSQADDFKKVKTDYEQKKAHSVEEFKAYTKSVKKINDAITHFNKTVRSINKTQKHVLNKWDVATGSFYNNHFPRWRIFFL